MPYLTSFTTIIVIIFTMITILSLMFCRTHFIFAISLPFVVCNIFILRLKGWQPGGDWVIDVLSNAFHPSLSVCRLLCATSSSQVISMLVAPSLAVCICCAVGGFIGGLSFTRETPHCSCPDCVVNLSCPAVHCTTGNFEISLTSLIYLGFGLLVTYLIGWAVKRQADCWEPTSQKRASVVDGRRPSLGTSSHWRPGAG